MKRFVLLVAAAAAFAGAPAVSSAQSVGIRGGASVNPDQFYFGAHVETDPIIERLHLRPNVEIGVGDDVTTVAVNIEAVYKIPLRRSPWTFYGGGGPSINYYNFDNGSDTEGGLNFVGGLEHDNGLFFEVKAGAFDSPDLKFGIGYVLGR